MSFIDLCCGCGDDTSPIGTGCTEIPRRMKVKFSGWTSANTGRDPWPADNGWPWENDVEYEANYVGFPVFAWNFVHDQPGTQVHGGDPGWTARVGGFIGGEFHSDTCGNCSVQLIEGGSWHKDGTYELACVFGPSKYQIVCLPDTPDEFLCIDIVNDYSCDAPGPFPPNLWAPSGSLHFLWKQSTIAYPGCFTSQAWSGATVEFYP